VLPTGHVLPELDPTQPAKLVPFHAGANTSSNTSAHIPKTDSPNCFPTNGGLRGGRLGFPDLRGSQILDSPAQETAQWLDRTLTDLLQVAVGLHGGRQGADMRGDTKREATSEEVRQLREEDERLKQLVAELSLANLTLKKSLF
jgi:hypothetical protein